MSDKSAWQVYMLQCADGSYYTGITTELERRVAEHNAGSASKYTRVRRPVSVIWSESAADRSAASRREAAIKKLSRADKAVLVRAQCDDSVFGSSPR